MPRFFFFHRVLSFFLILVLAPSFSPSADLFVLQTLILATPFYISRNADTPIGDPLDSSGAWILTGDKRGVKTLMKY